MGSMVPIGICNRLSRKFTSDKDLRSHCWQMQLFGSDFPSLTYPVCPQKSPEQN